MCYGQLVSSCVQDPVTAVLCSCNGADTPTTTDMDTPDPTTLTNKICILTGVKEQYQAGLMSGWYCALQCHHQRLDLCMSDPLTLRICECQQTGDSNLVKQNSLGFIKHYLNTLPSTRASLEMVGRYVEQELLL